jgi:hypothetical protein
LRGIEVELVDPIRARAFDYVGAFIGKSDKTKEKCRQRVESKMTERMARISSSIKANCACRLLGRLIEIIDF